MSLAHDLNQHTDGNRNYMQKRVDNWNAQAKSKPAQNTSFPLVSRKHKIGRKANNLQTDIRQTSFFSMVDSNEVNGRFIEKQKGHLQITDTEPFLLLNTNSTFSKLDTSHLMPRILILEGSDKVSQVPVIQCCVQLYKCYLGLSHVTNFADKVDNSK